MLGRFLEVSLSCEDVLKTLREFEALGFIEVPTGDVWDHPYAVVSDGRLNVGLHRYSFDSPSLTFVQSDLDHWIEAYRVQDIELAFEKLSTESFNELGFVDPGGQMTAVLESRTFSPPPFSEKDTSIMGRLKAIELPCRDADASRNFWRKLGLEDQDRLPTAGLNLAFGQAKTMICRYEADVLSLAAEAARRGAGTLTIANDESSAHIKIAGLTLCAHQSPG